MNAKQVQVPEVYQYGAVINVPAGTQSASAIAIEAARFGSILSLISARAPDQTFAPGAQVPVALRWLALAQPKRYTTFVHLIGEGQPMIAGVDGEPCGGWYPTDGWHAGEVVEYSLTLSLPPDLSPGVYDLAVGVYQWQTGERLPVLQVDQREADRAFVSQLIVK
ncbi:MAG: hypothetical protein FJ030_15160 [Chloroflexi bacterium]|nr:hypothetical protein [Chloroflexota bacterium]